VRLMIINKYCARFGFDNLIAVDLVQVKKLMLGVITAVSLCLFVCLRVLE
jgi:hypothetical protein